MASELVLLTVVFSISIFAMLFAAWLARDVLKRDVGTPAMQEISNAIREGAEAFIKRQYLTIGILSILVAALLCGAYLYAGKTELAIKTGVAFLFGRSEE